MSLHFRQVLARHELSRPQPDHTDYSHGTWSVNNDSKVLTELVRVACRIVVDLTSAEPNLFFRLSVVNLMAVCAF